MIIFQKITCFLLLSLLSITPYSAQATDFSYENEILEQYIENSAYKVYQNNKFLDEFNDFNTALEYAELWENATLVYEGILWHNFENMEMVNFSEKKGNTSLKLAPLKIYQNKKLLAYEDSFNEACKYAERWENSFVYGGIVLWDNYAAYYYIKNEEKVPCYDISDYIEIRKNISISSLYYANTNQVAYEKTDSCNHKISGVPVIAQYPELPRGCEVTSLSMGCVITVLTFQK